MRNFEVLGGFVVGLMIAFTIIATTDSVVVVHGEEGATLLVEYKGKVYWLEEVE